MLKVLIFECWKCGFFFFFSFSYLLNFLFFHNEHELLLELDKIKAIHWGVIDSEMCMDVY